MPALCLHYNGVTVETDVVYTTQNGHRHIQNQVHILHKRQAMYIVNHYTC